ncbi:MAG: hypothetical protein HY314_00965 [Acidobacteria bacterium]|nr:hypothetical protein [Acidobacteriota bacterium]
MGCSQIVAPDGAILASAAAQEEILSVVEVDPSRALDKHVTTFNDLVVDRCPEFYKLGAWTEAVS